MKARLLVGLTVCAGLLVSRLVVAEEADPCTGNLKALYAALREYAADHKGKLPPDLPTLLYRAYLDAPAALFCPSGTAKPEGKVVTEADCDFALVGRALEPQTPAPLVSEKAARHDGKRHVLSSDGTVTLEGSPGESPEPTSAQAAGQNPPQASGGTGTAGGSQGSTTGASSPDKDAATDFTGLAIDCKDLGVERAQFPLILDEQGQIVYPGTFETEPPQGIVSYLASADQLPTSRAGKEPLVIPALRKASTVGGSVVVSDADAQRIRAADDRLHFLKDFKVVFLTVPATK